MFLRRMKAVTTTCSFVAKSLEALLSKAGWCEFSKRNSAASLAILLRSFPSWLSSLSKNDRSTVTNNAIDICLIECTEIYYVRETHMKSAFLLLRFGIARALGIGGPAEALNMIKMSLLRASYCNIHLLFSICSS